MKMRILIRLLLMIGEKTLAHACALVIALCLVGCMQYAVIAPVPATAKNDTEASALSRQIVGVVDEVVKENGYNRTTPTYVDDKTSQTLATYFYQDSFSGSRVTIGVFIGGLRGVDGAIQQKTGRTIASIQIFGRTDGSMPGRILKRLREKLPNVQFRLHEKSEFTFV